MIKFLNVIYVRKVFPKRKKQQENVREDMRHNNQEETIPERTVALVSVEKFKVPNAQVN